ncbi:MAG: SRPBCC domain-containing protein, partial [Nostocoides sp.]
MSDHPAVPDAGVAEPAAPESAASEPTAPTGAGGRVIDLSVVVVGTPEQVWEAIATGPGISSWYVPTTVAPHAGGAMIQRFGEAPEMAIPGTVTAFEPPHRVVFAGGEPGDSLAFEWLVQARDGGSCVVRLVNSGFGEGQEWDAMYDGMAEGWPLFLRNLQLHLEHFAGQSGQAMLPMALFPAGEPGVWSRLMTALGWPESASLGDRLATSEPTPPLAGTVAGTGANRLWLLLDEPAPGTAIVAAEGAGVSVWAYLYGPEAADVAGRSGARWQEWLTAQAGDGADQAGNAAGQA